MYVCVCGSLLTTRCMYVCVVVYLAMYVVYVVVVVLGRIIYQYQKQATQCASANSVVAINGSCSLLSPA